MDTEPIEFDAFGNYDVIKDWDLRLQLEDEGVSSFCMTLEDVVSDALRKMPRQVRVTPS